MEIKGDLGLWGDLHDPVGIELLDNGDFQTTSARQGGQLCHLAVFLSPCSLPPYCRDVLRDSGRELRIEGH